MSLDRHDMERMYRTQSRGLLRYLTRETLDPEVALDLLTETFLAAYKDRRRFHGATPEDEEAWLRGIAKNRMREFWRRGKIERRGLDRLKVQLRPPTTAELDRVEELADLGPIRARVATALDRLTEDHRHAVQLRVVQELPYDEVAAQLNVSEDVARARVSRGLRRLKRSLGPEFQKRVA